VTIAETGEFGTGNRRAQWRNSEDENSKMNEAGPNEMGFYRQLESGPCSATN